MTKENENGRIDEQNSAESQSSIGKMALIIITSIICLLPICLSLALYDDLPEKVVMQWNFEGNPNWYAPKAVMAFGMPFFFMIINTIIIFLLYTDPKRANASKAMRIFTVLLTPIMSIILLPLMLLMNLGVDLPLKMIVFLFIGIIFIFVGNYLPKNKLNYSIGIRMSWTLNDPKNWNKTHRFASYLWVIAGILFIAIAFLPLKLISGLIALFVIMFLTVVVPIIYSYNLYKKEKGAAS